MDLLCNTVRLLRNQLNEAVSLQSTKLLTQSLPALPAVPHKLSLTSDKKGPEPVSASLFAERQYQMKMDRLGENVRKLSHELTILRASPVLVDVSSALAPSNSKGGAPQPQGEFFVQEFRKRKMLIETRDLAKAISAVMDKGALGGTDAAPKDGMLVGRIRLPAAASSAPVSNKLIAGRSELSYLQSLFV